MGGYLDHKHLQDEELLFQYRHLPAHSKQHAQKQVL